MYAILLVIAHKNTEILYYTFKMSKFPSFDHALDEKSFSILFCLPLNISKLINLQLKSVFPIFHTQAGIIQACDEL